MFECRAYLFRLIIFSFLLFFFLRSFHPQDVAAFREFLLVKLINGEKATFQTPTFSRKRERTLEMLIKDLYEEYAHDTKTVSFTFICTNELATDIYLLLSFVFLFICVKIEYAESASIFRSIIRCTTHIETKRRCTSSGICSYWSSIET